jgi:uncharacterized protein YjbJ (UPF0337 family)
VSKEEKEKQMNWDQFEGKWKQVKGSIVEKWGDLTDDDLDQINGKRERLIGRIQERYGIAKAAAEKQVEEWWSNMDLSSRPTAHHR